MPGRRGLAALGGIALGAAAFGGSAQAATLTVTNLDDTGAGSLRDALNQANMTAEPDTVTFASGLSGTIHLSSGLFAGPYAVAIQGPGAGQLTISGDGSQNVLNVGFAGLTRREFSISGVTITGGGGPSAGVFDVDANLTISNSVITGNNATAAGSSTYHGGGLGSASSSASVPQNLTIDHSRITNNTLSNSGTGARYGAGISAKYTNVAITDSTISGNQLVHSPSSTGFGGGISVLHGSLQLSRSTLSGNSSDAGGGLLVESSTGPTYISESTLAANQAYYGGGITWAKNNDPRTLTITGSTIAQNGTSKPVGNGGGILEAALTHPVLRDSIVSGNSAATDPDLESTPGSGFDASFSLIGNTGAATVNETVPGSNITGQDPQLGPLADNGGVVETMALPGSSPAVDKGAAFGLVADARGVLRPIDFPDIANSAASGADGSDIGAFELQPSNALTLGKLKKNKKKGTAVQTVNLPVPDAGTVTLSGKGLKSQTVGALATGVLKLKVIAKGKARKHLRRKGKAKVKETVTYNPTGQTPNTLTKKLKLVKRPKRH